MKTWKAVSQQYGAWADCTDVQAGLALHWWQRLINQLLISAGQGLREILCANNQHNQGHLISVISCIFMPYLNIFHYPLRMLKDRLQSQIINITYIIMESEMIL